MNTKIYVGTYYKYNNGSSTGQMVDLTDFLDLDEFIEKCKEIHKDESDPELMFQYADDDLKLFVTESSVDERLWDFLKFIEYTDNDTINYYLETINNIKDIDDFENLYCEKYNTEFDLAEAYIKSTLNQYINNNGELEKSLNFVMSFVDVESVITHIQNDYNVVRINGSIYSDYL